MERSQVRRALLIVLAATVLGTLIGHDLRAAAGDGLGARAALAAIGSYRAHVSPHLRGTVRCRFTPSCSLYGYESVRKYGLLRGGSRTAWRILRCAPWTKMGTVDPP